MPEPTPGSIFDKRYLILSELGAGGMGQVYHAKQVDANREVALKTLRLAMLDEQANSRFFREFKVLSELSHPHIMTVYGLSVDANENPYAICEYIEGCSLRSLLANGPLSWQQAVEIAIEIADALAYAHANGVIHRDLKPENIMLLNKPHPNFVKLIDFGLSKVVQDGAQKLTGTGQLIGSPLYMSPEQSRQAADQRSEIYSLGCIIFEMLSAQYLFPADEAVAAIYLHTNESATSRFTKITQPIPERLTDLLTEMLDKDPAQRCQSATELLTRLKDILKDPGKSFYKSGKSSPGKKQLWIIALVFASFMALIFIYQITSIRQPEKTMELTAGPKSFHREITDVDKEYQRLNAIYGEANLNPLSLEALPQKIKASIERLKSLEHRAKTPKEKFMVYWLEANFYSRLGDQVNELNYLERAIEQLHLRKDTSYIEERTTLAVAATAADKLEKNEKAKQFALASLSLSKKFANLPPDAGEPPSLVRSDLRTAPASDTDWIAAMVLAKWYYAAGNYEEASKYAREVHLNELKDYPQTRAGNATIRGTLLYTTCLWTMGKKEQAIKTLEGTLAVLNKPGDIPFRKEQPNHQRAAAADVLNVYAEICGWFEKNGLHELSKKYSKRAQEYAKYYRLEDFWTQASAKWAK